MAKSLLRATVVIILHALFVGPAFAAPPQVTAIVPRGWKIGANEITVQGANFTDTTRLLLDLPEATAVLKPEVKAGPNQLQFVVTIPPATAPGVLEGRVANEEGISNSLVIVVDPFPTVTEVEPNNSPQQAQVLALPAAVEGRLSGVESDLFAIDGKRGQRLVVELAGRRLGCTIKPVLRLFDANRLELQVARGMHALGGDARLIATLPADGRCYIELQDLVYRGDNNQYRLFVGDLQVAGHVFPLGGRRGTTLPIRFSGGTLAEEVQVPAALTTAATENVFAVALPPSSVSSPLPLAIAVGDHEEVMEQPVAEGKPQPVPVPVTINGRISQPGEQDRYQVAVTAGSKLRFAVQSERLGTPLDAVLELRNEQGTALATQDDGPGTADPELTFTVPAGTASLVVALADINGRGGEAFAYRLVIAPASEGDFELSLLNPLINVPAGGSASVRVRATRREFTGPIRLRLEGDFPAGVKLSGAEIAAGATDTFLSLTLSADAPLQAGRLRVIGEGGPADKPTIVRAAKLAKLPVHDGFPWLQGRFVGAVTRPGLVALDINATEPALLRGNVYEAKVIARRTAGQTGPINLTVQTSQVATPGQVPVAALANLTIAENATEGAIKINVPATATEAPLAFIVTGQLLDAKDKKTVVATAETPSVATRVAFPFTLQVAQPAELKRGVRNLVSAKLTRLGSFNQPIQVALAGLPATVRTGPVMVPPGVADFQIPILIPPAQPAGALANLKLTGTWATNPPLASVPLDVPLTVAAAEPPPSLEVFDDGADFVAALTEGPGTAVLETTAFATGKESVQVKAGAKQRAVLPGLSVPIVENPMPGQYRFLRFAWKKKGGAGIMLQLANNGQFGVAGGKGTDFRYVAGQDPLNSKAIRVANQPPAEWTVVTRDLFADHGPFTLTGLALTPLDGEFALFDHIYLARTESDLPPLPAK